jgi:hypothetical protein
MSAFVRPANQRLGGFFLALGANLISRALLAQPLLVSAIDAPLSP